MKTVPVVPRMPLFILLSVTPDASEKQHVCRTAWRMSRALFREVGRVSMSVDDRGPL